MRHALFCLTFALCCALKPALAQTTWYVDGAAAPGGDGTQASPFRQIQEAVSLAAGLDVVRVGPGVYDPFDSPVPVSVIGPLGGGAVVAHSATTSAVQSSSIRGPAGGLLGPIEIRDLVFDGSLAAVEAQGLEIDSVNGVSISRCHFIHHDAGTRIGGGLQIVSWFGGVFVEDCVISGNRAQGQAGISLLHAGGLGNVIAGTEGVTVRRCLFEDNGFSPGLSFRGSAVRSFILFVPDRMEDCVFRGNELPTIFGDTDRGELVGCLLENNGGGPGESLVTGASFGALAPDLIDCKLVGPMDPEGLPQSVSALCLTEVMDGCTVIGHPSGALGPLTFGTRISRTTVQGFQSGAALLLRSSRVERSTFFGTGSQRPLLPGVISVTSSIFEGHSGSTGTAQGPVRFSNLPGGPAMDPTNIDAPSLFFAPLSGDFQLAPGSPCIGTGSAVETDPDGSLIEMGAVLFDPAAAPVPLSYCSGKRTSEGCVPGLTAPGPPSLGQGIGLDLTVTALPSSTFGLFFFGPSGLPAYLSTPAAPLCIGAGALRSQVLAPTGTGACGGAVSLSISAAALSMAGFLPNDRMYAQFIARDPSNPDGSGLTFSNALEVLVLP